MEQMIAGYLFPCSITPKAPTFSNAGHRPRGCWAGAAPAAFQLLIQGALLLVLPQNIWNQSGTPGSKAYKQKVDL